MGNEISRFRVTLESTTRLIHEGRALVVEYLQGPAAFVMG